MTNCPMDSVEEYDDISTKNEYRVALRAGLTPEQALAVCCRSSRDNSRTPMQWDDSPNAGFTTGKPWLKVNPNYTRINAAAQEKDPNSVLHYYKRLLALRKSDGYREVFTYGDFEPMLEEEAELFAYRRVLDGRDVLVIGNFADRERTVTSPLLADRAVLLSSMADTPPCGGALTLAPRQAVVLG